MSEETSTPAKATIPLKRPRKSARKKPAGKVPSNAPAEEPEAPSVAGDNPAPAPEAIAAPAPEIATVGAEIAAESPKKNKRRRRKGKGGKSESGENTPASADAPAAASSPRPKMDAEQLSKFAWKIYLAEIGEEGVALIGDHDARELSRRCFRLAEIFLEEQSRRR